MDSSSSLSQPPNAFSSDANLIAEPMQSSSSLVHQLDQEMTNSSEFPAMIIVGHHLHNGSPTAVDLQPSNSSGSSSSSASSTSSSDEHQQIGLEIMDTQKESGSPSEGNLFNSYLYLLNNQQGSKSKLNNLTNLTNPATTPHFSLNASTNPASELDELAISNGSSTFNSPNPLNPLAGAGSSAPPEHQLSNNGTGLNNGQFNKGIPLF